MKRGLRSTSLIAIIVLLVGALWLCSAAAQQKQTKPLSPGAYTHVVVWDRAGCAHLFHSYPNVYPNQADRVAYAGRVPELDRRLPNSHCYLTNALKQ